MDMNNPLQQRTGQVAPTAQNPQNSSSQPYQQSPSSDQLQQTNSQLLEGVSGITISVPSSGATTTAAPVKSETTSVDSGSASTGVVLLLVIAAAVALAAFMILIAKLISKDTPRSAALAEDSLDSPAEVEKPQPKTPSVTKPKKSKKKRKKNK
jgi:hypothetical protein